MGPQAPKKFGREIHSFLERNPTRLTLEVVKNLHNLMVGSPSKWLYNVIHNSPIWHVVFLLVFRSHAVWSDAWQVRAHDHRRDHCVSVGWHPWIPGQGMSPFPFQVPQPPQASKKGMPQDSNVTFPTLRLIGSPYPIIQDRAPQIWSLVYKPL